MKNKDSFGNVLSKGQKVYWSKGYPNNGRGWFIFKIPLLKIYIIRDEHNKLIVCRSVEDLIGDINYRRIYQQDHEHDKNHPLIKNHLLWNAAELEKNKIFLNA